MIRKLLYIESIKTLYYPTFRAIIIIHSLLFLLIAAVSSNLNFNVQGVTIDKVFHFPHIWNTFAWFASWFNLLLGILAIILVTNEFQFRTFRKQLIDGLTRNELLYGKVIVLVLIAAYAMLIVFITGLVFGVVKSPSFNISDLINGMPILPILFIQSLGYMLMAMLFAFIIRNSALSIISFILFFFPIEPIIRAILPDGISKFLPVKVISKLTPMPDFVGISLSELIDIQSLTTQTETLWYNTKNFTFLVTSLVVLLYCILFIFISRILIRRRNF